MKVQRHHFSEISSTNKFLREKVQMGGEGEDWLVVADFQHNGRGQGSNAWISEAGKNLLISFLVHPAFLSASDAFQVSRMAALALCDLLTDLGLEAEIKWPNDILLGGKKVAGMLIENGIRGKAMEHSIVGIGLNVEQLSFPSFPREATSIRLEYLNRGLGELPGLPGISQKLEEAFFARQAALKKEGDVLEKEYAEKLYGLGVEMNFEIDGRTRIGTIRGVNTWGQLELQVEGQLRSFDMHGLRFLD